MSRCNRLGHSVGADRRQDHDRGGSARQQVLGRAVDGAIAPDNVKITRHQCQRLGMTPLAGPQLGHRPLIERVAGEMEATQPLDRDDGAGEQLPARRVERVLVREDDGLLLLAIEALQPQARAAIGTSGRLGMEAAVARSSYSARQAGHRRNAAMLVFDRS